MAAIKIKPRRVSGPGNDGYSETVKFEVLACGNVTSNNNKFYCIELQKNNHGEYRLFTHYGRIGKTNVYEVRDTVSSFVVLEGEYEKILKKKKRVSNGKSSYETVDTQEPTVGSDNIRNKVSSTSTASKGDLSILTLFQDDEVKRMVKSVWEENIHSITNLTTMKVSSSGISSPLGPLTISHVESATDVLSQIKNSYNVSDDILVNKLNAKYFSMIPHPFGMKIPKDVMINDDNKFMVEFDLLEQMKAAIKVGGEDASNDQLESIGLDIDTVRRGSDTWKSLEKQYVNSRADCHRHLSGWNIKNIFAVDHNDSTDGYTNLDQRFKDDEFDLFHGSRACNILSIMMNGLIVPPKTAGHVTGRMFGDGIYAASASTKALNYATGYWAGGTSNKHRQAYMFVVRFAMGKMHYPDRTMYNGAPSGYDSIWAKKGKTSLANDEFIVYRTDQAKITHLLQLED